MNCAAVGFRLNLSDSGTLAAMSRWGCRDELSQGAPNRIVVLVADESRCRRYRHQPAGIFSCTVGRTRPCSI